MITDQDPNISFSDGNSITARSSAGGSSRQEKGRPSLVKNEFFANEELQIVTDELLDSLQNTEISTLYTEILPKYISSLHGILNAKKYYSESETDTFSTHLFLAILPLLYYQMHSAIKVTALVKNIEDVLELYSKFTKATASYQSFAIVNWIESHPLKQQQIESYTQYFDSAISSACKITPNTYSVEVLVSDLLMLKVKTMRDMPNELLITANIDVTQLIKNCESIFSIFVDKITYQIIRKESLDLKLANSIAYTAFEALGVLLESMFLGACYWKIVTADKEELFDLNFMASIIAFNWKVNPAEPEGMCEISMKVTNKMIKRNVAGFSKTNAKEFSTKIQLIADPKFSDRDALTASLQKFYEVKRNPFNLF